MTSILLLSSEGQETSSGRWSTHDISGRLRLGSEDIAHVSLSPDTNTTTIFKRQRVSKIFEITLCYVPVALVTCASVDLFGGDVSLNSRNLIEKSLGVFSDAIDDALSQIHLGCDFIAKIEIQGLSAESKSLCYVGSDLGEFEIVFLLICGDRTIQSIDLRLVSTVSRDRPLIAEIW